MSKSIQCAHRKYEKSKCSQKISRVTEYSNRQYFFLDKGNVAKVHNWEFFSCRRCFLSFHLKVKVVSI